MATIRIPEKIWKVTHSHLFGAPGEHFAFFLARWTYSNGEPVFLVNDVIRVPDSEVFTRWQGLELSLAGIAHVVNTAVKTGACLVEIHNHGGSMPRFSITDRNNLPEFVEYILSSLPDRPYAATVWGDDTVYGEHFLADGRTGILHSITVLGKRLRSIVSIANDISDVESRFSRQLPWFMLEGQQQLGQLKIGIVGCGGTGSHVIQNLVYLGCHNFILVDRDRADESNLNRLVTASAADVGTPKTILGRRLIKSVAPKANVLVLEDWLRAPQVLDILKGVDILFGCVDNDGARLILNELALAYCIPYIDVAVGIEAKNGEVNSAGGRVVTVLSGGPCLHCMNQIDINEANYFLASQEEQARSLAQGYIAGVEVAAPAVVSLNGQVAAAAVNELAVLVSGLRPANCYIDFDLLGTGRTNKGQWMSPTQYQADHACIVCTIAGSGDEAGIETRFARTE